LRALISYNIEKGTDADRCSWNFFRHKAKSKTFARGLKSRVNFTMDKWNFSR
jgi:hypothetical protein